MDIKSMNLSAFFLTLSLVATLNANQSIYEKYTELKNDLKLEKMEANRSLILQNRDDNHEIRDYRDVVRDLRIKALYARIENSYTPYR